MPYTLPQVSDAAIITVEGDIGPAAVIALQRRIVRALDTATRASSWISPARPGRPGQP